MEQRLSLITLGVADVAQARAFYERLGWSSPSDPNDGITFFQCGGLIVSLWERGGLAHDSTRTDSGGWGGVTLAQLVDSPDAVDQVLKDAVAAGATLGRPGAATFWGGYSGVFVDPNGHPWEIAHNPGWALHDDGSITLG